MKNECNKTRPIENPYEIWLVGGWEWRVLKKWQADDNKPYARWFCAVKSPLTYGDFEYGDVYVSDIKSVATRVDVARPKEDRPEAGKIYALTGAPGSRCIANGNTWKESEVKNASDDV